MLKFLTHYSGSANFGWSQAKITPRAWHNSCVRLSWRVPRLARAELFQAHLWITVDNADFISRLARYSWGIKRPHNPLSLGESKRVLMRWSQCSRRQGLIGWRREELGEKDEGEGERKILQNARSISVRKFRFHNLLARILSHGTRRSLHWAMKTARCQCSLLPSLSLPSYLLLLTWHSKTRLPL